MGRGEERPSDPHRRHMVDVAVVGEEISGRATAPAAGERKGRAVGEEVRAPDGIGVVVLLLGFGSVGVGR
jgi:hypothetical protein